ncbi:uncharacterized protein CEXT_596301 [Caerostris extrusa]|uniref:Uncharacterized protein n=1 Tax=Caerostris extrusa TaxID=172846 RepID=A0AAV4TFP2_CAEEX|nr:uncharacterized protein CEXT_596301 [Caerostris extrusa]
MRPPPAAPALPIAVALPQWPGGRWKCSLLKNGSPPARSSAQCGGTCAGWAARWSSPTRYPKSGPLHGQRHEVRGRTERPSKYPDPNPYSAAKSSIAAKEQVFHKTDFFHTPKGQFGDIIKDQNEVYDTPNRILDSPDSLGFHEFDEYPGTKLISGPRRVPGRFADTSLPEEALGIYGGPSCTPLKRGPVSGPGQGGPPDFGLTR